MRQRPHEKLVAWKEAFDLCLWIYKSTKKFPATERYALSQQAQRSACSVPLNIAEGNTKRTPRDKIRFFDVALGSLEELHCQMKIAYHLGYIPEKDFHYCDDRINKVSYPINRLRESFNKSSVV